MFKVLIWASFLLILAAWTDAKKMPMGPLPDSPDYNDPSQWYIVDRHGDVDLFYIISTETGDHMEGTDTCHFANTKNSLQRKQMLKEMVAVDSFYSGKMNYFSPFYRQASMQSWASEEMALSRLPVPISDVLRSWEHYLKHYNRGRPFVIAGFSQGAHAMMTIMKQMPDSVARRMIAAYFIGYKVTVQDTAVCPYLRPAQGAHDTGVSICFNSVKDPSAEVPICSGGNIFAINPVNWRTDTLSTPFVLYGRKRNDTLSVSLDPASRLLLVKGYQNEFMLPVIGRPGNYHYMELKFYWPYIRQNMADRVAAYFRGRDTK